MEQIQTIEQQHVAPPKKMVHLLDESRCPEKVALCGFKLSELLPYGDEIPMDCVVCEELDRLNPL